MIKIEQKFITTKENILHLTKDAEFLGEENFTDVYYDTKDYALTKNDFWLRSREGNWQLKIPKYQAEKKLSGQFNEIEGEEKIREIFGIVPLSDFETDIAKFGYAPFCEFRTIRKKYRKENFIINLDEVEDRDFNYCEGKIEMKVEDDQTQKGRKQIEKFAAEFELKLVSTCGKVYEYLKRKKPEHFQTLIRAKVFRQ